MAAFCTLLINGIKTTQHISICALGLAVMIIFPILAYGQTSAVIIMYHRFGESGYPTTNTTIQQLEQHITELKSGPYTVLPVEEIIDKFLAGTPLPRRTVGITIDDAYRSVYTQAWPRFKQAGIPFTVFTSTAYVDQDSPGHLSWEQIREMRAQGGVAIGHHTVTHLHMPMADEQRNRVEIDAALKRFKAELGITPQLFSYPYGETSLSGSALIRQAGFKAAFGQHSGVLGSINDAYNFPRFAMNEKYGDLARFRMAINAMALPVQDLTPKAHVVGKRNPPAIGFTLRGKLANISQLACFTSHAGRARLEHLGPRIEVRIDKPFPTGRTRLNCTLPATEGRWRWLGRQFLKIE